MREFQCFAGMGENRFTHRGVQAVMPPGFSFHFSVNASNFTSQSSVLVLCCDGGVQECDCSKWSNGRI